MTGIQAGPSGPAADASDPDAGSPPDREPDPAGQTASGPPEGGWWSRRARGIVGGLPDDLVRPMLGVAITSFGVSLGIGVIFPLVPIFARDLGISLSAIGALVGAFGIARIGVGVLGGRIFSRLSERAVGAAGAATVAIGSLLTAFARSFEALLVARVVHGLGVALFVVAGLVFIGRAVPPGHRGRILGLHQGSMLLAASVGPVLGAFLAQFGGVQLPFFVAAGFGVLSLVFALRTFPSSGGHDGPRVRHRITVPPGWRWTFTVMLIASFVTWGMRTAMRFALTPVFVTEGVGAPLVWSGIVLALMSVGDVIGLIFGGRWLDRRGRRPVFVAGSLLTAASIAAFPLVHSTTGLVVVSLAFGVVGGLCSVAPAAMAADLAGGNPAVVSTSRLAGDVGVLVGPIGSSSLLDLGGYGVGYGAVAASSVVAAVAAVSGRETIGLGEAGPADDADVVSPGV